MQRIIEQKIINQTNQALLINVLADAQNRCLSQPWIRAVSG